MQIISTNNSLESKKKTVNNAIRICVNCGSIAVCIDRYGVFCKDCGSLFDVEEKKEKEEEKNNNE